MLLQIFVLTMSIWRFQEIFPSKYIPRNFVKNSLLIRTLSMCNGGKIFNVTFLFLVEWSKKYFVLEVFKESLLALNEVLTSLSSSFIVSRRFSIFELEISEFVSSAHNSGASFLDLYICIYIKGRDRISPRMVPCGIPQVILRYILFSFLPSNTNCCWCFK